MKKKYQLENFSILLLFASSILGLSATNLFPLTNFILLGVFTITHFCWVYCQVVILIFEQYSVACFR